jgi:hypothetical protein
MVLTSIEAENGLSLLEGTSTLHQYIDDYLSTNDADYKKLRELSAPLIK